MPTAFEVLAEPNRRLILDLIRQEPRSVNDLVELLSVQQPSVSKHLKVLREAGLVDVTAAAQRRIYHLRAVPLREIDDGLAPDRAMWSERLDALEAHLDAMDPPHNRRRARKN